MTSTTETRSSRERVFEALKTGPCTRPELASRTGLSLVTVIAATEGLVQARLATLDQLPTPAGRGRPAAHVRLLLEDHTLTALDLGGSRVTTARYNLLGERTQPPDEHGPSIGQWTGDPQKNVDLLCEWLSQQGRAQLSVVSVLGAVNPQSRTLSSHPLKMQDYPLEEALSARLGWPVLVENDANLSAWHTWDHLKFSSEQPLVHLNYSHGIGLGMVLCGKVYYGFRGAAGEVCQAADPEKHEPHGVLSRKLLGYLHHVLPGGSTTQVARLAAEGNPEAREALKRFNQDLANHLTAVAAILDPALLVLQDIPDAASLLLEEVQQALGNVHLPTRVTISPLGAFGGLDSAGAYGARWLERLKLAGLSPEVRSG